MQDSSSTNSELIEEIFLLKQRIQQLEQSESELRKVSCTFNEYAHQSDSIFNAINNSVCVVDPDGRIIKCNRSTEKLFNKSSDELNGHFCFEVVHGESKPLPGCPFLRMKETKRRESMVIQSHGRWLDVTVDPILDDNQRIVAAVHIIVDITEHKKADEALRKNEDRLKSIFRAAPVGIGVVSDRVIVEANDRLCAMTGYQREELVGQSARMLYPDVKDFDFVGSEKYRQIADTGTGTVETRWCMKNGKVIHVLLSSTPFDLHDISRGVTFTALDITERKQAEQKLNQQADAMKASMDGIAILNADQKYVYMNDAHARIYGYETYEELIGQSWRVLYNDDELQRFDRTIMPQFGQKGQWQGEATGKKKDGSFFPQEISLTTLDNGGLICAVRDITERKEVEEVLKESEAKYRALFENAVEGIFQATPEGRFLSANPAQAKIFGYDSPQELMEEVTDISGQHYVNQKDRETYTNTLAIKGIVKGFEVQLLKKDRNPIWVSLNTQVVRNEEGAVIYYEGTVEDITEHKRIEKELQESEERYRIAIENSNDGIAIMKGDEHLYVNQRFVEMFGYDNPSEVIGKSNSKTVHPDDFELVNDINVRRQRGEPVPARYEFKGIKKDGTPIYIDVSATGTKYQGDLVSLVYLRDITDRKKAEEEITREREKLKTLSDNAPFGMVLIDKEGHFTYINRKFTELFGYELSDIPDGSTWCRKAYPDDGYRQMVISAWLEDLGDAMPGEQKNIFTVTCKDGTEKIVQFIFSVLISGDFLMACEDITELKHIENQLRQAHKMESIGTLAGGIAHDFNNILTALMGYASLIQIKMDRSDPLRAYVDEVLTASEKAVDLTQSLLAFSRKQPVTLVSLDINKTIKAAEKLLRRLLTEDVEFRTSLHGEDMIIMADKSQMDQILFNLVTNARDAMPKGGALTIETELTTIDSAFIKVHGFGEPGKYARISITDTGMGMDETTRQKIFDPFFTTKEAGKGTGLGLATVYGIVKTHKGYIIVDSIPKEGTAFHIYLPQARAKINTTEDMTTPIQRGKETILIAEDNEGVRRFIREALQGYGYTIREATDGKDAIDQFKQYRDIDLIIIDSVMPKKNGRDAYEEIHKIDPHIKALFTSGYTKDVVLDKGIEEKEFDFIAKPLSLDKLLQKVREVLDRE